MRSQTTCEFLTKVSENYEKGRRYSAGIVMLLSLTVPAAFAAEADSYKGKMVILYTGNLRGDVDYAQIAVGYGSG